MVPGSLNPYLIWHRYSAKLSQASLSQQGKPLTWSQMRPPLSKQRSATYSTLYRQYILPPVRNMLDMKSEGP